jgi:hypothetical protein
MISVGRRLAAGHAGVAATPAGVKFLSAFTDYMVVFGRSFVILVAGCPFFRTTAPLTVLTGRQISVIFNGPADHLQKPSGGIKFAAI